MSRSSNRVEGDVSKTAGISILKSDVSILTPVGAPGILHDPVAVFNTNKEHSVIVRGALAIREDTTNVVAPVRRINGNSNRCNSQSFNERLSWSIHLLVTRNVVNRVLSLISLTSAIHSLVRIVEFSSNSVLLNVLESQTLVTTVAATVSSALITTDELLFRKVDRVISNTTKDQSGFDGTSRGESPAWTAVSLVLNTSNLTSFNPVDVSWSRDGEILSLRFSNTDLLGFSEISFSEFSTSHSHKLGDSQSAGLVVVSVFEVLAEHLESVVVFVVISVLNSVL